MSKSYQRAVSLLFEQYEPMGKNDRKFAPYPIVLSNYELDSVTGKNTELVGLRIAFKIIQTTEPTPNISTIRIYNLQKTTRSYIEAKYTRVTLTAGYLDSPQVLFIGDVVEVDTAREGPDLITELQCGDGEYINGSSFSVLSYGPGVTFGQLFDKVKKDFGLSSGPVKGVNRSDQFNNGFSFIGLARDAMHMLTDRQGLEWSIQNEQLQILPELDTTDDEAVVISPDLGLIGSPFKRRILRQDRAKKQNGFIAESGVLSRVLLNARLRPGRPYVLSSEFTGFNQSFKVYRAEHHGDTHGQEWYSDIEGRSVPQGAITDKVLQAFADAGGIA